MQSAESSLVTSSDPESLRESRIQVGFGFRLSAFGFRVSGFGFRVSGFGFGFRVSGFGFGFRVSGFRRL